MSSKKETITHTLVVAFVLCIVCSIVVAGAAVVLKPTQVANKTLDRNKNMLSAAGLYKDGETSNEEVANLMEQFSVRFIDLDEGQLLTIEQAEGLGLDPQSYDQRKASKQPELSQALPGERDIAGLNRRARYAKVFVLENDNAIDLLILPVHGYGLWGTLYGFLALDGDLNTVKGLGFYEHKETPGLGGEVDNPKWKAQWIGKEVYAPDGDVAVNVSKTKMDTGNAKAKYHIDSLSGATLTSRGVDNMLKYWMGPEAYGPILDKLRG
ncbi:MAG: Na(+)-translocating NADH-quinone reductase subunit C [Pseudomonadales bacterium]